MASSNQIPWTVPLRFAAFAYGVLFHYLLLKVIVNWGYRESPDARFIHGLALNLGFPILGGLITVIAVSRLSRFLKNHFASPLVLLLRAGVYGFLTATVALQFLYLALSLRLGWLATTSTGRSSFPIAFVLSMLGIELYGLIVIVYCFPFAVTFGITLGLPFLWSRWRRHGSGRVLGSTP
jgi:hypothetical protein